VTQELKSHLQNYESAFKQLYTNQEKEPVNVDKVLKPEVLEILGLLKQDHFELKNIDGIYRLVKLSFADN
jgi:hypothetical protein